MSQTKLFIIVTIILQRFTGNTKMQWLHWVQRLFFSNYKVYIRDFTAMFPFVTIYPVLSIQWPIFFLNIRISLMLNLFPILILTFHRTDHGVCVMCGPKCILRWPWPCHRSGARQIWSCIRLENGWTLGPLGGLRLNCPNWSLLCQGGRSDPLLPSLCPSIPRRSIYFQRLSRLISDNLSCPPIGGPGVPQHGGPWLTLNSSHC